MGGGKGGGGGGGAKALSVACNSALNTVKSAGTIQYATTERPVGVAFHNGRIFYFGMDIFGQPAIYFSQLLTDVEKAGYCYQEADPTADEINDLIATDGGVLRPVGVGTPIALMEAAGGVLAFASNGVWVVRGPEGSGFSATNFQVGKVTDKPCLGSQSIVEVEGAVLYFSDDGVVQLAPDEFGRLQAVDITNDSIKQLYLGYSRTARAHAAGCYVDSEKRIYWTVPTGVGRNLRDSRNILVLATDLPGFYQWSIVSRADGQALHLPFQERPLYVTLEQEELTLIDGVTIVTDNALVPLTEEVRLVEEGATLPLFVGSRQDESTFAVELHQATDPTFRDFGDSDFLSFVEFGYQYGNSKATGLSAPYIHSFFKRGERAQPVPETPFCVACASEPLFTMPRMIRVGKYGPLWNIESIAPKGTSYNSLEIFSNTIMTQNGTKYWLQVLDYRPPGGSYTDDHCYFYEMELSTPYDLTTATLTGRISENLVVPVDQRRGGNTSVGGVACMSISADGLHVYVSEMVQWVSVTRFVHLVLTVPGDLTTATVQDTMVMVDLPGTTSPWGAGEGGAIIHGPASDAGSSVYILEQYGFGGSNPNINRIYKYLLSTPYDLRSIGAAPVQQLSYADLASDCQSFMWDSTGKILFVAPLYDSGIRQITLSTPYDLTTKVGERMLTERNFRPDLPCFVPTGSDCRMVLGYQWGQAVNDYYAANSQFTFPNIAEFDRFCLGPAIDPDVQPGDSHGDFATTKNSVVAGRLNTMVGEVVFDTLADFSVAYWGATGMPDVATLGITPRFVSGIMWRHWAGSETKGLLASYDNEIMSFGAVRWSSKVAGAPVQVSNGPILYTRTAQPRPAQLAVVVKLYSTQQIIYSAVLTKATSTDSRSYYTVVPVTGTGNFATLSAVTYPYSGTIDPGVNDTVRDPLYEYRGQMVIVEVNEVV